MGLLEKPDIDDVILEHYGISGMKWGLRKGKKATGVSRFRGAIIDRNDRQAKRLRDARVGKGPRSNRVAVSLGRKVLGEKRWESQFQKRMSSLKSQNSRLRSGKLKVEDRLQLALTVPLEDLFISNRPK